MADRPGRTERAAGSGTTSAPPVAAGPGQLRNVVLVGHCGAGKTTLVEALLLATGTVNRAGRVEDGTTVCDFDEVERRQQRSIGLALAPVGYDGLKINLLDTPGYPDFVGELRAGLRAADAALFVVSAADGVDATTQLIWEECAAVGMPRAVVVTRLDSPRADFEEMVAICQRVFGDNVLPLHLPMHADDGSIGGLVDLLSQRITDYTGSEPVQRDPDPEHLPLLQQARNTLIEGIIAESEDESLMDRYLAGEDLDTKTLVEDLEQAVARGSFHPVLAVTASTGLGVRDLLDVIAKGFPSPLEHPLPLVTSPEGDPRPPLDCDPDGPLLAEVVKTVSDPYVGRISLVRVFSGTLRPDTVVHVSGHGLADRGHEDHDVDERIGAVLVPLGARQRPGGVGLAGDVVSVAKLVRAETGDTLSEQARPLLMEAWAMPDPLLPVAIRAHAKSDEDKLAQSLGRLVAEDPTLRLEINPDTHQLVLWCMGEAHLDLLLDRLGNRYGVEVDAEEHRVSLRETFAAPATGRGRHVKQSGGHGQYAVCDIEVEPLPAGSGFEFAERVVGGAVPRQFIPSVEKGVRAQLARGVAAGYRLVDVRVTLVDGKAHVVDSSDMAFQTAGALAVRDAASRAAISLLEPVAAVEVVAADEYVGAVMSDLSGRRGRVLGSESAGNGRTAVRAEVPEVELNRYAVELRSVTHGTGAFGRRYLRHEPMPAQLAAKVLAETGRD